MRKYSSLIFVLLCLVCPRLSLRAQISAQVPSVGVCLSQPTTFTAPAAATSGTWNFGGGLTSTVLTGIFTYTNAGTYTVTFSGTTPSGPSSFSLLAFVYLLPVANFSITSPLSDCAPKTITVTDLSTGGNTGTWTFGDGGSAPYAPGTPASHAYTSPGNYNVALQITSSFGCSSTITTVGTVSVFASPVAVISSNPVNLSSCTPPFSAVFSASNSTGQNMSYAWNFGNSQTSSAVTSNPVNYTSQGTFPVTLTVTANGCSSVASTTVVVSATSLAATLPQTVCLGAPISATVISNQAFTTWSFPGGITVPLASGVGTNVVNVQSAFTSTGVVTLSISAGAGACLTTITRTVFVDQVVAQYASPPPAFSCASPFNVQLQNLCTPNATQFTFSVPAFQQSTLTPPPPSNTLVYQFSGVNPTFTIPLVQGSQNPYSNFNSPYSLAYAPSITLVAQSLAGCTASVVHTFDSITRPTASFYKDRMNGCAPLQVTYNSNSYVFGHDPVTSYTWCNGATPPVFVSGSGPVPQQVFSYTAVGTYSPYLVIATTAGCVDTSFTELVTAANPPVISFSFTPSTVCPNQPVQIVNTTAPSVVATVNHWHVTSDAGYFSGCINEPNPSWNFTHVGVHGFTMSAYVDGCRADVVSANQVTVLGPVVSAVYETNCTNRMSVNFFSKLQSATSATLTFGDSSPAHVMSNSGGTVSDFTTHIYSSSGNYIAKLKGVNPSTGCDTSVYTMTVTVRDIQATISSTPVTCINTQTSFDASASQDVLTGCSRGYVWYVDNGPPLEVQQPTFSASFLSAGTHSVSLWVKDANSCTATFTQTIRVSSVTPAIGLSSPSICINGSVQVVNTSTSVALDPIVSQSWNFGTPQIPPGNATSHTVTYNNANVPFTVYVITLSTTNSKGCTAVAQRTLQVKRPNTFFQPSATAICVGPGLVTFSAQPAGGTYTMNFGEGLIPVQTSTSPVFTHTYMSAGMFSVTLRVKDAEGCQADGGPIFINAQITPTANFSFSGTGSSSNTPVVCSPTVITYTDLSLPLQTYTYGWNVYPGVPSIQNPNVVYTYTQNATEFFSISHTVTTSNGCTSSITRTVALYSPRAKITANKRQICLNDPVTFGIKDSTGSGVMGWYWQYDNVSPNTGTVLASSAPPASTVYPYNYYPPNGVALVRLSYFSSQYACSKFDTLSIRVLKTDADFRRNNELARTDTVHCLRAKDTFSNTSPGSAGATFLWSFGNGTISLLQHPEVTYEQPGVYQVTLVVTGTNTCKGQAVKGITVNPLPTAAISAPDSVCQNSPFLLQGSGSSAAGISAWQWQPASAVNNAAVPTTTATATSSVPVNYSLSVTDGNTCVSDPVTYSLFIQPPARQISWDTTVIVGQSIPIQASQGSTFTYSWLPYVDLNCQFCTNPLSTSTVNITYSVVLEDGMKCFRVTNTYSVLIDPQTSVDVPTAFTPNGDGVNDVIYPDGWGIKSLFYFRVFNRWGQLLFESNDIKVGWDGTFNGVPQNMDTYIYQVAVETYLDQKPLQKTSSFRLIR